MGTNSGEAFGLGRRYVPDTDPSTWTESDVLNALGVLKRAAPQFNEVSKLEQTWETLDKMQGLLTTVDQVTEMHEARFAVVHNPLAPDSLVSKFEDWLKHAFEGGDIPENAKNYLAARRSR